MKKLVPLQFSTAAEISNQFLNSAKMMIFLTAFLLTITAVKPFPMDSRDCFEFSEMDCMENFVDAVFHGNREIDECIELRNFVDCSTDAVDECFGDERDKKIHKGLEELENLFTDTCGDVSSGGDNDFDEESYSHIQLTVSTRRKKKRISYSTTDNKRTSVSSDSKKCFNERKKVCWDIFENAVIHSVFYSSTGLDKCSVLRHFVLCSRQAADDCFVEEYSEDADEILEVWENKSKEFCEADVTDEKSVFTNRNPIVFKEPFLGRVPNSDLVDYSKNCMGEQTVGCFRDFLDIRKETLDECRKVKERIAEECSKKAVDRCLGEEEINKRRHQKIDDLYKYLKTSFEELCESDHNSKSSYGSLDYSRVQSVAINTTGFSHLPLRKDNCRILRLEMPVFERVSSEKVGAWFLDAMTGDAREDKYYSAVASDTNHLYEYNSRDAFRSNYRTAIHEVPFHFSGTGHLVYNDSFYYHEAKSQMIVRFDFNRYTSYATQIADASYDDQNYLYSSELGYMDVMADENGLWVVYSAKDTENTMVRKLHPYTLVTEYMWNLTLPHRSVGEMFIACGILYVVDSVTAIDTRIRFAFDLYESKVLETNLRFYNPFRSTSMIAYNPKHHKLFTWDKGSQLSYPVKFHIIDQKQPEEWEDFK